MTAGPRMSPRDAVDLADSMDLPDGAYFAMLEDLTGMDAADVAMASGDWDVPKIKQEPVFRVAKRDRRRIEQFGKLLNHDAYHWQVRAPDERGAVLADWWPHKGKWRIDGKIGHGNVSEFVKALKS